jgi:hypothetical protein
MEQNELYHYGVKGMKWGHRKAPTYSDSYNDLRNKKAAYKSAKKDYNKSYNKAYNYSARHPVSQWGSGNNRVESDKRWDKAIDSAKNLNKAERQYKSAKQKNKQAIKNTYKDINKNTSFGKKLLYNEGTRKKAAKYVVNNGMSVAEATKKAQGQALRNTAIFLGAYGIAVAGSAMLKR